MKDHPTRNRTALLTALAAGALLFVPAFLHSQSCCGPSPGSCPEVIFPQYSASVDTYSCSNLTSQITYHYSNNTSGTSKTPPDGAHVIRVSGTANADSNFPGVNCTPMWTITPAHEPCNEPRPVRYSPGTFSEPTVVMPCPDDNGSGNGPGSTSSSCGSIHISFNLGFPVPPSPGAQPTPDAPTQSYVHARVDKETIDPSDFNTSVFSTAAIVFPIHPGVQLIDPGAQAADPVPHRRRQVLTASGLFDFSPEGDGYWMRHFLEKGTATEGFFPGVGNPATEWRIKNVTDGAIPAVEISRAGFPESTKTIAQLSTTEFRSVLGSGERIVTVEENPPGTTTRTVTKLGVGQPFEQEVTIREDGRVVERRSGIAPALIVTKYDYSADGYLQLMRRFVNDGVNESVTTWERYIRKVTGGGLQGTKTVRPYKNLQPADMSYTGAITNTAHPAHPSHDEAYLAQGHVHDASSPLQFTETVPDDEGGSPIVIRAEETTIGEDTIQNLYPGWTGFPGLNGSTAWKLETSQTFGGPGYERISHVLHRDTPEPLAYRPFFEQDREGRTRRFVYRRGNWNAATGTFTEDSQGTAVETAVIHGVPQAGPTGPMAFVTKKEVRIEDTNGYTVQEEEFICSSAAEPPQFGALTRTVHRFDSDGHLLTSTLHSGGTSRITYEAEYVAGRKVSETDETGIRTDYENPDALGRSRWIIRRGVSTASGLPAIADRTTKRTFDPLHRVVTEDIEAAGSPTIMKSWIYDVAGRPISETLNGMTVTSSYPSALVTTRSRPVLLPNGQNETVVLDTTLRSLDGETEEISGTAVLRQIISHGARGGMRWRRVSRGAGTAGAETAPLWTETETGQYGHATEKSLVGTAEVKKHYFFDGGGNLISEGTEGFTAGGSDDLAPRSHQRYYGSYGGFSGLVSLTTQESGEAANGTRTKWSVEYHVKEGAVWYRVVQSQDGTEKEKVSSFDPNEISKTIRTDVLGNVTTTRAVVNRTAKTVTETVSRTGHNSAVTVARNGVVQSATTPSVSAPTIFGYDGHGRRTTVKDARTGQTTVTTYDPDFGQPATISGPGISVINEYYPKTDGRAGRLKMRTENSRTTFFDYDNLGQQVRVWGHTYPLRYEYDLNGRLSKLHTYKTDPSWTPETPVDQWGNGDVTTWQYFPGTTQLQQKLYADGQGPSYTYWPSGLLKQRTWARPGPGGAPLTTGYTYNDAGELKAITYSDGTPSVAFTYNAKGERATATDGAGSRVYSYNANGDLEQESFDAGPLNGITLDPGYNAGYLTGLTVRSGATTVVSQSFNYTNGRLTSAFNAGDYPIFNAAASVNFEYLANSDLPSATTVNRYLGGSQIARTERTYDTANRLLSITARRNGATIESHTWTYDAQGRRERDTLNDGSYWQYAYNTRAEVTAGVKKKADGTPWNGYRFGTIGVSTVDPGYTFDAIGNRTQTKINGRTASYSPNALNQYTQRDVPGAIDVVGREPNLNAAVSVNNVAATRQDDLYYAELPENNASVPIYRNINVTVTPPGTTSGAGSVYLAKTPEDFSTAYDAEGNLTGDGRFTYTWDGENRLASVETHAAARAVGAPGIKEVYVYDWRGRRVMRTQHSWNGSAWVSSGGSTRYVYDDGWNLLVVLQGQSSPYWASASFLWANDLSGTRHGAGGVGGLVAASFYGQTYAQAYLYDGNGNVTGIVDGASGPAVLNAKYEFGPFGEPLRQSGNLAGSNPFRFSTKFTDTVSGLVYYGYRYYHPGLGKWLSRDPIEEKGGVNLYLFVENDSLSKSDYLGQVLHKGAAVLVVATGVVTTGYIIKISLNAHNKRQLRLCGCRALWGALEANVNGLKGLSAIIQSGGEETFEQHGLSHGGTLGAKLGDDKQSAQGARDTFEDLKNTRAYRTAMGELAVRTAFGFKNEKWMIAGEREVLATALLKRLRVFQQQLLEAAATECQSTANFLE